MELSTMGSEIQWVQITHPMLGMDKVGSQMFLKVVRHQSVQVGEGFAILPTRVFLARSLQVDLLEDPSWECQCGDTTGTAGPLGKLTRSVELPGRPVMASEVPIGMSIAFSASSSSFGDTGIVVVEESQALFGDNSTTVGACFFLDVHARIVVGQGVAS